MTTTINKLKSNSRTGEVNNVATLINKCLAEKDWSADKCLSKLIPQMLSTNALMVEAIKRLKQYSKLEKADDERDWYLKSLFGLVGGCIYIPFDDVRAAAEVVNGVLSQYGVSIIREPYNEASSDIGSLLNDLQKPDIAAACAQIQGVPELIASLTQAEEAFETLALDQVETEVAREDVASATTIKGKLLVLINGNLVPYLNTMVNVDPDTYYPTAETIALIIDHNNENVMRRSDSNLNYA